MGLFGYEGGEMGGLVLEGGELLFELGETLGVEGGFGARG